MSIINPNAEVLAENAALRDRPRACVVAAVTDSDGRMLLGRRLKRDDGFGKWVLPGGGIDARESFTEALRRELREECGIEAAGYEHAFTYRHIEGVTNNVVVVFRAHVPPQWPRKPVGGDDLSEPRFFMPSEIAGLDTTPATRLFLGLLAQKTDRETALREHLAWALKYLRSMTSFSDDGSVFLKGSGGVELAGFASRYHAAQAALAPPSPGHPDVGRPTTGRVSP